MTGPDGTATCAPQGGIPDHQRQVTDGEDAMPGRTGTFGSIAFAGWRARSKCRGESAVSTKVIRERRSASDMIPGLRPVDTVMFLFYLVLLALGVVADVRNAIWFVPLGLSVVCAMLWFVARRQLGLSFSVRPEARQLVTTGFYARFRHPIYVFGTMAFLLVLLAWQGWQALAIWAILIPVQVIRARREERVLTEAFGAEYEEYRKSTWF